MKMKKKIRNENDDDGEEDFEKINELNVVKKIKPQPLQSSSSSTTKLVDIQFDTKINVDNNNNNNNDKMESKLSMNEPNSSSFDYDHISNILNDKNNCNMLLSDDKLHVIDEHKSEHKDIYDHHQQHNDNDNTNKELPQPISTYEVKNSIVKLMNSKEKLLKEPTVKFSFRKGRRGKARYCIGLHHNHLLRDNDINKIRGGRFDTKVDNTNHATTTNDFVVNDVKDNNIKSSSSNSRSKSKSKMSNNSSNRSSVNDKFYKYSGRYRSRMLRKNNNDDNNTSSSTTRSILATMQSPSIHATNINITTSNVSQDNTSKHNTTIIDLYHKNLGPGKSISINNDDVEGEFYQWQVVGDDNHEINASSTNTTAAATDVTTTTTTTSRTDVKNNYILMKKQSSTVLIHPFRKNIPTTNTQQLLQSHSFKLSLSSATRATSALNKKSSSSSSSYDDSNLNYLTPPPTSIGTGTRSPVLVLKNKFKPLILPSSSSNLPSLSSAVVNIDTTSTSKSAPLDSIMSKNEAQMSMIKLLSRSDYSHDDIKDNRVDADDKHHDDNDDNNNEKVVFNNESFESDRKNNNHYDDSDNSYDHNIDMTINDLKRSSSSNTTNSQLLSSLPASLPINTDKSKRAPAMMLQHPFRKITSSNKIHSIQDHQHNLDDNTPINLDAAMLKLKTLSSTTQNAITTAVMSSNKKKRIKLTLQHPFRDVLTISQSLSGDKMNLPSSTLDSAMSNLKSLNPSTFSLISPSSPIPPLQSSSLSIGMLSSKNKPLQQQRQQHQQQPLQSASTAITTVKASTQQQDMSNNNSSRNKVSLSNYLIMKDDINLPIISYLDDDNDISSSTTTSNHLQYNQGKDYGSTMNSKFGPGSIVYSSSQNIINRSTTSSSEKRMTTATTTTTTTTLRNKEIQIRRPKFPMFAFNDDDDHDADNRDHVDNHHKMLVSTPLLSSSSSSLVEAKAAVANNISDNGGVEELSVTDVLDLASTLTDSTQPTLE